MGEDRRLLWSYRLILFLLIIFLMLRSAWISDDALITLRTALNLANGWGPGFNATENVQAFTHPLWFLLWLGIGMATNQWLIGVFALSIAMTSAAIYLLLWCALSWFRITLIATLVVLSNSFFDFTTSGLENPLAYLTIAVLFLLTTNLSRWRGVLHGRQAALTGLLISAVALTRLDLLVLLLPVLVYLAWSNRRDVRALATVVAFSLAPLIVWFTWSYLTYSSLLPNTYLAKTNSLIPQSELLLNGIRYLWVSFSQDPISLLAIMASLVMVSVFGTPIQRAWGLGSGFYLLYAVWIGGDFMAGRFLAVPILVSLLLLATIKIAYTKVSVDASMPATQMVLAISLALLLGLGAQWMGVKPTSLANPQIPRWDLRDWAGVADERGEYVQRGSTLADFLILGGDFDRGETYRRANHLISVWPSYQSRQAMPSDVVVTCGPLGIQGIQAGPAVHIIDECALADRFLAEQVYVPSYRLGWRPGHLDRDIPAGYVEAVANNDPSFLVDPNERQRLTELWERIR